MNVRLEWMVAIWIIQTTNLGKGKGKNKRQYSHLFMDFIVLLLLLFNESDCYVVIVRSKYHFELTNYFWGIVFLFHMCRLDDLINVLENWLLYQLQVLWLYTEGTLMKLFSKSVYINKFSQSLILTLWILLALQL